MRLCPAPARYLSLLLVLLVLSAAALLIPQRTFAAAGINKQITFQGKVVNKSDGTNVSDGNYNFTFSIYSVASGGSAIWTDTYNSGSSAGQVAVTSGVFRVNLGEQATALPGSVDFNTDTLYLGVNFNGDGEMSPRIRLTAVPQAFNSFHVAGLTVQDGSGAANTTGTIKVPNGSVLTFPSGTATIADAALDNLASVAINTTLLPASNNSIDLGSGALQFRTLYVGTSFILGTSGGNSTTLNFTSPTAANTITFPNAGGTVAVSASNPLSLSAAGALSLKLTNANDADSTTSNNSGLITTTNGVGLLRGCSNTQVLQWTTSGGTWGCGSVAVGTFVNFAPSSTQTDSSTNNSIDITKTGTSGSILSLTDTSYTANNSSLSNITFKNNNTVAGITVNGETITANAPGVPSSGTNTSNLINLSSPAFTVTTAITQVINGLNLSSPGVLNNTGTAGTINWSGVNLTSPDTTTGVSGTTILNDGVKLTIGTLTATNTGGTMNGVDIVGGAITASSAAAGTTNGIRLTTAALSSTSAATQTINGLNLSSAGAIVQSSGGGTINWTGLSLNTPAITQTSGTVASNAISLTGGTITSGTANGINFTNTNFTNYITGTGFIVTSGGNITAGTYNTTTLSGSALTFGTNSTDTVNANANNILTLNSTSTGNIQFQNANSFITNGGALTINSSFTQNSGTHSITSITASGSIFTLTDTSLTGSAANLANLSFTNANTGSGVSVNGLTLTANPPSNPSSGTNTTNFISLSSPIYSAGAAANIQTFNAINLSSGALTTNPGTVTWNGLNLTTPNITQTSGTLTSNAISLTGGTITSGTANGINFTNTNFTNYIKLTNGGNSTALNFTAPTGTRTITFPDGSGNVCLDTSAGGSVCTGYAPSSASGNGYVQLAPSSAQSDSTTNNSIYISKTGTSGSALNLTNNSYTAASSLVSLTFQNNQSAGAGVTVSGATLTATAYVAPNSGTNTTNFLNLSSPTFTQSTAVTSTINGLTLAAPGALIQSANSGTINFNAINLTTPNITQTSGTVSATALNLTLGSSTTGGSQTGVTLSAGSKAGTTNGISFTGTLGNFSNLISSTAFTVDSSGNLTAGTYNTSTLSATTLNLAGTNDTISNTAGTLTITPAGALTVGATGQNLTLQGATTSLTAASGTLTVNGASAQVVRLQQNGSDFINLSTAGLLALSSVGTNQNITLTPSGTGSITSTLGTTSGNAISLTDTSLNAASASLANLTFKNNNSGAGVTVNGLTLTANVPLVPSSGTNTTNFINLSSPTFTQSAAVTSVLNAINLSSPGNLQQDTAAGTLNWNGLNFTTPAATVNNASATMTTTGLNFTTGNITQTAGTVTANGLTLANGTITTGGTENLINLAAAGVGAGTLNAINIGAITAGAGAQNAITIGTGWNKALTINNSTWSNVGVAGGTGTKIIGSLSNFSGLTIENDNTTPSTFVVGVGGNSAVEGAGTFDIFDEGGGGFDRFAIDLNGKFGFNPTAALGAVLDIFTPGNQTTNSEYPIIRSNTFTQTISAAVTNARFNQFLAPTITAGTAQIVTNAATLYVDKAPIAAGSASITNAYAAWIASGSLALGTLGSNNGSLIFNSSNASNFKTTINASASQSASITYVLPLSQGGSNTFLKNDGSGNLSWAAAGGSCTDCVLNDTAVTDTTNTVVPTADVTSLTLRQTSTGSPTKNIFAITNSGNTANYAVLSSAAAWTLSPAANQNLSLSIPAGTGSVVVSRAATSSNSELVDFQSSAFTQTISGAVANARFNQFLAPTLSGAFTVTNAATLYVDQAPIAAGSATITNDYALWINPTSITTQTGLAITTNSTTLSSGVLEQITHNGSYSTNVTDSGNLINLNRALTSTANTLTLTGALASLTSNCTVSGGACADSSNVLAITQSYASATGSILQLTDSSTSSNAIRIDANSLTSVTGGALTVNYDNNNTGSATTVNGIYVNNTISSTPSSGTNISNMITLSPSAGQSLRGINMNQFTSGGTATGINMGMGWNTGFLLQAWAGGFTQTVAHTGANIDYSTNLIPATGLNLTGYTMQFPNSNLLTTTSTTTYTGYQISAAGLVTTNSGGTFTFNGVNLITPAITSSAAITDTVNGLNLGTAGAITQQTAAGTINWAGVNLATPNSTLNFAASVILNDGVKIAMGTHTQSTTGTGTANGIDLSVGQLTASATGGTTNGINLVGGVILGSSAAAGTTNGFALTTAALTLTTATTQTINGFNLSSAGTLNNTGTAGTINWAGINLNTPAVTTGVSGTTILADGIKLSLGQLTATNTGGTVNGIEVLQVGNILASSAAAGTTNGINFSTSALTLSTATTQTINGVNLSAVNAGALSTSAAGTINWTGINLNTPGTTSATSGNTILNDGIKLTVGTLTATNTGGTTNGLDIIGGAITASSAAAGTTNGINLTTAALALTTATTQTINAINLGTANAISTGTAAGTINWSGINLNTPAATNGVSGGTILSDGIKLAVGTLTATNAGGTTNGIDITGGAITGSSAAAGTTNGIKLTTAALTSSVAVTQTINGLNLSSAGALATSTAGAGNIINWAGLNITTPASTPNFASSTINQDALKITTGNITQTAGAVNSTGLNITLGSITTGGTSTGLKITSTGTAPTAGTFEKLINAVDNNGNSLFEVRRASNANNTFGALAIAGAFMNKNSYWGEEFNNFQINNCSQTTTTNNNKARGDFGNSTGAACTAGNGELGVSNLLGVAASGNTCLEQSETSLNGLERISATSTATASNKASCAEYLAGSAAGTAPSRYWAANNLPVVTMKLTPLTFAANANAVIVAGLGAGASPNFGLVTNGMPNDGVFFSNCTTYSTTAPTCPASSPVWVGWVASAGASVGSVTCTAGAETGNIVQGKSSYLRIEVRSNTDIHFFVDTDTSTGINETECGTGISGTGPGATGLTAWLQATFNTNTATTVAIDVDYIRIWQDDNITPVSSDPLPATSNVPSSTASSSPNPPPTPLVPNYVSGTAMTESYPTDMTNVQPGTVVAFDPDSVSLKVKNADRSMMPHLAGVTTPDPGMKLGDDVSGGGVRVATHGRAAVRVSNENGAIKVGDALTAGKTAGVATKATKPGFIIGRALANYDSKNEGTIPAQISIVYDGSLNPVQVDDSGNFVSKLTDGTKFIWQNSAGNAVAWVTSTGDAFFTSVQATTANFKTIIFGELVATKDSGVTGHAQVTAGKSEVFIPSTKVKSNSTINLTATSNTGGLNLYVKKIDEGKGFTVGISNSTVSSPTAPADILFNWLIISQQ